jgi:hypothetical protein
MRNLVSISLTLWIVLVACEGADTGTSDAAAGAEQTADGGEEAGGGRAATAGGAREATGGQGQAGDESRPAAAGEGPGADRAGSAGQTGQHTIQGSGGSASASGGSEGAPAGATGEGGAEIADGGGSPETEAHDGASRFILFGHDFASCTWFDADLGFCSEAAASISATSTIGTDLYKTTDAGHTWDLVSSIDGDNSTDSAMKVFVLSPTEIWYITGFTGLGFSGTIGRSTDGGSTWTSLTDAVHRALADDPEADDPLSAPLYDLAQVGDAIWLNTGSWSQYLAMSSDGGTTWERVLGPVDLSTSQPPEFIATDGGLMLRYTTRDWGIALYRLSGNQFVPIGGDFPPPSGTDHGDTWWRASTHAAGVSFADQRAWPFWGWPFVVSATFDQGSTFETVYSGTTQEESGCEGLRDAVAFEFDSGKVVYVSGVFVDAGGDRFVEIRRSVDEGSTWKTLHSQPEQGEFVSVALDPTGKVHAMRHWTDAYGNTYVFDGQYVLE